jgi:hypothetical protein
MNTSILEHSRIKKMMGLISEQDIKRDLLSSNGLKNNQHFKNKFLLMLKSIFEPTGTWGTANKPEIDCYTNFGVIGIYTFTDYSERLKCPKSNWSVINFFNTSGLVLDSLLQKFRRTDLDETVDNFLDFINEFIREKKGTSEFEELVIMNLRAITKGSVSENEVYKDIKDKLKLSGEFNFCPGSKTDTKGGQDFILEKNGLKATFQVKPLMFYNKLGMKTEVFTKKYPTKGYNIDKVDYIIFHNQQKNEYIILENDTDIKIQNDLTSKKGFVYDKVLFNSIPINVEEIRFR